MAGSSPSQTNTIGAEKFLISSTRPSISCKGILILPLACPASNSAGLLTSIIIFLDVRRFFIQYMLSQPLPYQKLQCRAIKNF